MATENTRIAALAPAKLNLFLHILGQRDDGYHRLETVFQFLDWADELHFTRRDDAQIHLRISGQDKLLVADNLVMRAAKRLQAEANCRYGADIILHKRIPLGSGLGGGSSDAATTLLALNQLWQLHYDKPALQAMGLTLGADVPIFIHGKAAFAAGVGEIFHDVSMLEPWYLLALPACNVSTQEIFSAQQLTRDTPPSKMCGLRVVEKVGERYALYGKNDCQAIVCERFPAVKQALEALGQFATARMTGTGAAVFAPYASYQLAASDLSRLPAGVVASVVKGANVSSCHLA